MFEESKNVTQITSGDGKVSVKIGSKIKILEETGWTNRRIRYPYEGIVTELVAEWDNGSRFYLTEDWGPNMITLGDLTFYPNENFTNIEVLEF